MNQLTEKECLIAKIGLLSGVVAVGFTTSEKATDILKKVVKTHGFSFEYALELEKKIDQMLGDSTLV